MDELTQQVTRISGEVTRKMNDVHSRLRKTAKQCEAKERARALAETREDDSRRAGIAKRIPLARQGLQRILEVARSIEFTEIFSALAKLNKGRIIFFVASRPSGEDWDTQGKTTFGGTRDVQVAFSLHSVHISTGSLSAPEMQTWEFQHGEQGSNDTLTEEFLETIAYPYPLNMSVVARNVQWTVEWNPNDVVFQMLVSCAKKRTFERYLTQCLKNISV